MPQFNEKEKNLFYEIQKKHSILTIASSLGIDLKKVGNTYRSGSIAPDGGGENAFCVYPETNRWFDFKLGFGGDITDLVAYFKFNGDKKSALLDLLPEYKKFIDPFFAKRKEFQQKVEQNYAYLVNPDLKSFEQNGHILEYLHKRKLTDEYIKKIKIGVEYPHKLFIPYWDINGKEAVYYITRRLPDIYGNENQNDPKYKKASLENNPHFKNSPWGLHTLNRENDELFITEGIFDAMLLDQSGASVLTPNGGDFGQNWDYVINLSKEFKSVILAFDNDEAGKEFTFKAAQKFIKEGVPFNCAVFIGKDIAEFYQAGGSLTSLLISTRSGIGWLADKFTSGKHFEELTTKEKEKIMNEFEEFLCTVGRYASKADITRIINQVKFFFPKDWLKDVKDVACKGPEEIELATEVIEKYGIIYDDRVGAYIYNKQGIWEPLTESELGYYATKVIGKKCTSRKASAVKNLVKFLSKEKDNRKFITSLDKMPCLSFKNGTVYFDYKNRKTIFKEHSPEDYVTVQTMYNYNSAAKSKIFIPALNVIFNGNDDSITTLQEFYGYSLLNDCRFHKALFNLGCGGNGKSVVTEVLRAMLGGMDDLGRTLVTSTPLDRFNKDFRAMVLKHSWVNISSETDSGVSGIEARLKALTSGEPIEDSYKNKDPMTFISRAKSITNCNVFPRFSDRSRGLERRCLFLDFPMNFVDEPTPGTNERKLDPDLIASIINDPEEMAAIFNWALEGLFRILRQKGFTITKTQKRLMREFMRFNNPVLNFVEDKEDLFFDEDGNGKDIKRTVVFSHFKAWAAENGEDFFSARHFYHELSNTIKGLSSDITTHQKHGEGIFFEFGRKPAFLDAA